MAVGFFWLSWRIVKNPTVMFTILQINQKNPMKIINLKKPKNQFIHNTLLLQ